MKTDNDLLDLNDPEDREISLGTSTILGIFLALALLCAAVFGLGYTMGRKSAQAVAAANAPATPAPPVDPSDKPDTTFSNFKTQPDPAPATEDKAATDTPGTAVAKPSIHDETPKLVATPVAVHAPAPATSPAAALLPGQLIVQISATSREGDANSLIAALHRKGYNATIRHEPQDALFHVQIGPFSSKKEADAMRLRLDGDGYKAIVK